MSGFNRIGEGYLVSYRDPNLEKTMEIYEGVVDYLKNFDIDDRDMNKFIIGTISNLDRPMNPAAKGSRSLNLYMNRITEEMIRRKENRSWMHSRRISVDWQQYWRRYWQPENCV